jgi:hypothetical protein
MDVTRRSAPRGTCPNCGGAIAAEPPRPWTNVARITNLAEAGFLTDELVGMGIDAQIHQSEDFNALSDRWTPLYFIRVPAENAEEAADRIQQYRDDDIRRASLNEPVPFSSQVMDPQFWRPVALVMLTGIASFVLGQRMSGDHVRRPMASDSLPSTANQIGRPFVTEPAVGQPRYRLSFDARQQAWSLDTDRDNDGQYDARQRFRATGAAW